MGKYFPFKLGLGKNYLELQLVARSSSLFCPLSNHLGKTLQKCLLASLLHANLPVATSASSDFAPRTIFPKTYD